MKVSKGLKTRGTSIMFTKAVILFVLCWYSVAGADYEVIDDESSSKECGKGNKQFKKHNRYFYQYDGQTKSGILGKDERQAQIQISAKISIRFISGCTYAMKIHSLQLAEKQGNTTRQLDSKTKSWLEHSLQEHDLLFTMDQGLVVDIRPKVQEREKIVLNIKRGMLGMFQLKWAKRRDGQETDVSGTCSVTYQKARKNGIRTIVKTKDLDSCHDRSAAHSVIKTVKYGKPLSWYESSSSCDYRLRRKNEIEEVECEEVFRLRPFSAGASSGGYTKSRQTMRLLRINSNRKKESFEDFYVTSLLFGHEHPHEELKKQGAEINKAQAETILKTLARDSGDVIQPEAANLFSNLVMSLRVLNEVELGSLVTLAGKCFSQRTCDPEQRLPYESFLFDALAQCGSTVCVRVVSGIVSSKRIQPKLMKQLVSSMALIQTPTIEMINVIMDLHLKTKEPSILALLGTIVNTFCSQQEDGCSRQEGPGNIKVLDAWRIALVKQAAVLDAENYMLRLLGNDCTVKDPIKANEILHALKAIGNAGRPVRARELIIDCARNAAHQNVSIAALHTIQQFATDIDLKDFLYEMLADKNVDLERRMETFFILMGVANAEDALLIVDMVNDVRDAGQLRSLMHSYIHSILRTQDPFLERQKENFQRALRMRNLTEFDLPMSRFSHYKSWSFHLDGAQLGATAEAMMFFHPESFIPRTLRLNFTSNLFGHAMHEMGVDFRSEGLEFLVADLLKKGGYLSSSYLQKIFAIPDAMPGVAGMQVKRRQARSSGSMPAYERRLEELQNEINLKEPWPQFSLGVKVFGREISVLTLEDLPLVTQGLDRFNIIEQLFALSRGARSSVQRNLFFLESQYIVPTILGLPLKLQTNGSAVAKMGIQGTVQISNVIFGPKVLSLKGSLSPSLSMELSGRLTVDGYFTKIGVHVNSSLYSASVLDGKLTYTEDSEFDVDIKVPEQPTTLLNISQNVFHLAGNTEIPVKAMEKEAKVNLCSSDLWPVKELIGIDLCSEVSFPVTFHQTDAPSFPLTGPSHFGLVLVSRDQLLRNYNIRVKKEDEVYRMKVSTPGAEIPREYKMELGVSVSDDGGVIGAVFGESRKGLMLRYEYDNTTHSVKAQLDSNLTEHHTVVNGHYFNSTDPVTLQKKFGYEIGIKSQAMDVFNRLQFEDTYEFWAVDFFTKFSKQDVMNARFEIRYEPQVISLLLDRAKTHSMFYLELKPGFPAMSSHFNLTHGPAFAMNGTGMVDLQNLIGEGEFASSPAGQRVKGRFEWINKKRSKGFIAKTTWGKQYATLNALFSLKAQDRVLTTNLDINGYKVGSIFQFNGSHLNLSMDVFGQPVTLQGYAKSGMKRNQIRMDLAVPPWGLKLEGGAKKQSLGQYLCANFTFNGTQYDNCILAKFDENQRTVNIYMKHPTLKEATVTLQRQAKSNGYIYGAAFNMYGIPLGKLDLETQRLGNDYQSLYALHLPSRGILLKNTAVSNRRSGKREYSFSVEKTKGYSKEGVEYQMAGGYLWNPQRGITNSSFSLTGVEMPEVRTALWTVQSVRGKHALKSHFEKLGLTFSMVSPMTSPRMESPVRPGNRQRQPAIPYGLDKSEAYPRGFPNAHAYASKSLPFSQFAASVDYTRQSKLILKASQKIGNTRSDAVVLAEVMPSPKLTLRVVTKGEKVNVTELVFSPNEELGYTEITLRHPEISGKNQLWEQGARAAMNEAIQRFEALMAKTDRTSPLRKASSQQRVEAEIARLTGKKLDPTLQKKLATFVVKGHRMLLEGGNRNKALLRQKVRKLFQRVTASIAQSNGLLLLETLLREFSGEVKNSFISQFVRDLLQILVDTNPTLGDVAASQKILASVVGSYLNSSLDFFFQTYNISQQTKDMIKLYAADVRSLLTPLSLVQDPNLLIDAIVTKIFSLLDAPNVGKLVQMHLASLSSITERYLPSSDKVVANALVSLFREGVRILSDSLSFLRGAKPSFVSQQVTRQLQEAWNQFVMKVKSQTFDSNLRTRLFETIHRFVSDLDLSEAVKSVLEILLEEWKYPGDVKSLINNLLSLKDASASIDTFIRVAISETSADPKLKAILNRFETRQDLKSLWRDVLLYGMSHWNVSEELKTQLLHIVNSENATVLTRMMSKTIFGNVMIPLPYRHVLEKIGDGDLREAIRNLTRAFLQHLQALNPGLGLSTLYESIFQKWNVSAGVKASFDDMLLVKFLKGLDSDFDLLLKDKDQTSFVRSMLRRFLTASSESQSLLDPQLLGYIKKWLLQQIRQASGGLAALFPEPVNMEAEQVLQEFIQVIQDIDFTRISSNATAVVQEVLSGWTAIMKSSKVFEDFLTHLNGMGADLGNLIEIDGRTLPQLYTTLKSGLQDQILLGARIFSQISEKKYKAFQARYVQDGNVDLYQLYQDFLEANLTGTQLQEVDHLVSALSGQALHELKGRTNNFDKGTVMKSVLQSIMAMNYSGVNPVLEKYGQIDYGKFSNLSRDALLSNALHLLQGLGEIELGGQRLGDQVKSAMLTLAQHLEYAEGVIQKASKAQAYQRTLSRGYLVLVQMNATQALRAAFNTLSEDTKGNIKLRNVIETLGLPLMSGIIKLIGNSRVGNATFRQVWTAGLNGWEEKEGETRKADLKSFWQITEIFVKLQQSTSIYEASESIMRLVDSFFNLMISIYDRDTEEAMDNLHTVNLTLSFLKDFIRQNSHLPLVQMVPRFYKEAKAVALAEYNRSPILRKYVRAFKSLYEFAYKDKLQYSRHNEVPFLNHTGQIYDKVNTTVRQLLNSEDLRNSVPVIIKKTSQIASRVLKESLLLLDRVRTVLKGIEFFRDPKRYFGVSLNEHVRKALQYWQQNSWWLYTRLNEVEIRLRARLKGVRQGREDFKKMLANAAQNSDYVIANFTSLLHRKFDAADQFLKQMRSDLAVQSEEYIYRLFLNWDVLVNRVSGEINKLFRSKDPKREISILEWTQKVTEMLRAWRRQSVNLTEVALDDYYSRLSQLYVNMQSEWATRRELVDSLREAMAKNMSQVLSKLPFSPKDTFGYIERGYNTTVSKVLSRINSAMNETHPRITTWRSILSKGWRMRNGTLTWTLPWAPRLSLWEHQGSQMLDTVHGKMTVVENNPVLMPMGAPGPIDAVYQNETEGLKTIFEAYNAKFDHLEQLYKYWLANQTMWFSGIAKQYQYLVDRITINATDYVFQLYRQRFLRPFKSIAEDASIATPVNSVPPMPTFPRVWSEMTAMFRPMTRTAVLYGGHIFTFDGQYVRTAIPTKLRSSCTYVLARDFRLGNFTLLYQDGNLVVESVKAKVILKKGGKMEAYEKFRSSIGDDAGPYSDVPLEIGNTVITKDGPIYRVQSDYGFEVNCNTDYMLCNFTLSGFYHNKTLGLFGTNNQEFADDLRLPGGRIAVDVMEFLNEWELTQAGECRLQNQRDFLSPCRRLPSPRCREVFKDTRSPLARAFRNVNPSPFLMACEFETSKCDSYSTSRVAHCPIATAYVNLASSFGVSVPYLQECASCKDDRDYEYTVSVNRLRRKNKAVDIVVLVKESADMASFLPTLKRTLSKLEEQLKLSGMDIAYRLVGFEGYGYRMQPHSQTGNTEDAMTISELLNALDNLEFDGYSEAVERQGLSALRYAAGLPLRPLATKIFLLVENNVRYSGRLQEMISTNDVLTSQEIALNVINNYRLKRGVIGKSASGKRYHVKLPKGEQLRSVRFPPADDYVPIVRETGGAILTLKGLFSSDDKFLKAYPVSLSNIVYHQIVSDLKKCKKCSCQQDKNGFGIMRCVRTEQGYC